MSTQEYEIPYTQPTPPRKAESWWIRVMALREASACLRGGEGPRPSEDRSESSRPHSAIACLAWLRNRTAVVRWPEPDPPSAPPVGGRCLTVAVAAARSAARRQHDTASEFIRARDWSREEDGEDPPSTPPPSASRTRAREAASMMRE